MQIAIVAKVNTAKNTAQVKFDDDDDYISDDLQILSFGEAGSGYKPKVGQQVVIDELDNGDKIIIGCLLSDDEQGGV